MGVLIPQPHFTITMNNVIVTQNLKPYITSISYTDHNHGESDDLNITLENSSGIWTGAWYPEKGIVMEVTIGIKDSDSTKIRNCGTFDIDEVEASGPPDVVNIKGLASKITIATRQKNTVAYEDVLLSDIAATIANKHGLELKGSFENIKIKRVTQNNEEDLAFLKRIAEDYGYVFKQSRSTLTFWHLKTLESQISGYTINRTDVSDYSFRDKSDDTYKSVELDHHNPETKSLVTHTASDTSGVIKADAYKIKDRSENKNMASKKAAEKLYRVNRKQVTGNVSMFGNPYMVAGLNVNLSGFGVFDGTYQIETSSHTINKSQGYTTSLSLNKV